MTWRDLFRRPDQAALRAEIRAELRQELEQEVWAKIQHGSLVMEAELVALRAEVQGLRISRGRFQKSVTKLREQLEQQTKVVAAATAVVRYAKQLGVPAAGDIPLLVEAVEELEGAPDA